MSDEAFFVLMAMLEFDKRGDKARLLTKKELEKRPSIIGPLRERCATIDVILRELYPRFITASGGFKKVRCTADRNVVKHRFVLVRNHLRLNGRLPTIGRSVQDVAKLREAMHRVCCGQPPW
ncbi:MAG: hypothetical protein ACRECR_02705 [Thermoplasmata archaeon]